jgi:hypothetical protein
VPVALWIDDAYMSIPFLAQLGKMTSETKYFDDAARQVIGMSARLFDRHPGSSTTRGSPTWKTTRGSSGDGATAGR